MVEKYPWWNEEQRKLADEVEEFAKEKAPRAAEATWKKEFPWDIYNEMGGRGWFGTIIPEEYGGLGPRYGVTACCIVAELTTPLGSVCVAFSTTMFGGTHQIAHFGNEEQKERWLPGIAKGKLMGAITLTEPFVGSDAGGVETTARREGDEYVILGKKRFISNTGLADIYMVYARTSDDPKDIASRRHLSAFIVEKGTPGFSVEKINELSGWDGVRNGYLNFDEVRVPAENRLGEEGDGWNIMISGLNFERTLGAAGIVGTFRDLITYAVFHSQRRIQFNRPTATFQTNMIKLADVIASWKTYRLLTYYAAYLVDRGEQPLIEATAAKVYGSEAVTKACLDMIQVMGGDGLTKFYPLEYAMRSAKIMEIGAGTNEVLRLLIARFGLRLLAKELEPPKRRIHKELGVPIPYYKAEPLMPEGTPVNEENVLKVLAEDYRANPGLFMTVEDLAFELRVDPASMDKLEEALTGLEEKGLVKIYRDRAGRIALAKATYKGLKEANPPEYYRWFPSWVKEGEMF